MNKSYFGCSYQNLWVSPNDWQTTTSKKAVEKDWYIQCNFFDPSFPEKGTKGFVWRKRINKIKDLKERQAAVHFLIAEMTAMLKDGFNPITKEYMVPQDITQIQNDFYITKDSGFYDALEFAFSLHTGSKDTRQDIKSILKYFRDACLKVKIFNLPVTGIRGYHVRQAMDNIKNSNPKFSDKRYNKYIAYLSSLFQILETEGLIDFNPLQKFRKKPTVTQSRKVLTIKERQQIDKHLKDNYYRFWLFTNIFFHSGGREIELLSLKYEDIDFKNMLYTTLVRKGGQSKPVSRPIKEIALDYWLKALLGAKEGDYIFSKGLLPGVKKIRRDQITRRWHEHVKKKLNITADFYSLKHSNLDEITARTSVAEAARAAGHTTTEMVTKHYAVGEQERLNKRVQQMNNLFAPQ